jgi:hypothetical protein
VAERDEAKAKATELREDSNRLLVGGATLGTFAAVTGAIFGATCPMCIVVAPLMLGAGAVQRWRCARAEAAAGDPAADDPAADDPAAADDPSVQGRRSSST